MKKCITCREEKPLGQYYFRPDTKKYKNQCKECRDLYISNWHKNNSEYIKTKQKEYYINNKDRWPKWEDIKRNPKTAHIARMAQIKYKFKICEEQVQGMMDKQKGLCPICCESLTDPNRDDLNQFNIDHNHKTGEVRGLLCSRCNSGLGYLGDNPDILRGAIEYLYDKGFYNSR